MPRELSEKDTILTFKTPQTPYMLEFSSDLQRTADRAAINSHPGLRGSIFQTWAKHGEICFIAYHKNGLSVFNVDSIKLSGKKTTYISYISKTARRLSPQLNTNTSTLSKR